MNEATYIKQCPECGRYNEFVKVRARNTKLSMENLYICSCGKKYIEYRYFMNENSKGKRTNAERVVKVKIKSKKTGRVADALKLRDGSFVILVDGKKMQIENKKVQEISK